MMGTDMVELKVGPQKQLFRVHKAILCKKVAFFDKMFNGGWKEASNNSATLPEDSPESIDLLIGWVYSNTIRPLTVHGSADTYSWQPVPFWELADKLCLPELQDRIMDAWIRLFNAKNFLLGAPQIEECYNLTAEGSPIRHYACQSFVFGTLTFVESAWPIASYQPLLKKNDDLARDFLLALRGQAGIAPSDPRKLPKCDFHVHEKGAPCSYMT
jgi:hypothetical protein